ncbi:MAG: TAXI family TRAP transporter solute-binding subunit, partial [Methyloligellaceae bacterium]
MLRKFLTAMALSALFFVPMNSAFAQSDAEIRDQVNKGTVSIITGGAGGEYVTNTYMKLAGDMAAVLDKQNVLRILPIMSYGPVQNIRDLLYLKGIDIGMVHSDVFTYLKQKKLYPTAQNKLRFIVNLYDEPFHVIARQDIRQVKQLAGRKVVVGKPGSGGEMSAHTLFAVLGIKPKFVHYDWKTGIEKVRNGEAAAMVYATPMPSKFLQQVNGEGLHFLPLPASKSLLQTYQREALTSADYP